MHLTEQREGGEGHLTGKPGTIRKDQWALRSSDGRCGSQCVAVSGGVPGEGTVVWGGDLGQLSILREGSAFRQIRISETQMLSDQNSSYTKVAYFGGSAS